jgi:hypothetical protein
MLPFSSRLLILKLVLLPCLVGASAVGRADARQQADPAEKRSVKAAPPMQKTSPGRSSPQPLSLDNLKLPGNAVLVICEQFADALRILPKAIILSPQEYQSLVGQIDELTRSAKSEKPGIPSVCRLSGFVDDDVVRIHAQFEFKTHRDKTVVNLGCQRAWPTAATLDGQLPPLQMSEEGCLMEIDTRGVHEATLDLMLPLAPKKGSKGTDRGFELALPGAAITNLKQFDLSGAVAEVRLGSRTIRTNRLDAQHSRVQDIPVTPLDRLDISWKAPAAAPARGSPVLTATARTIVRIHESQVSTNLELSLEVIRGIVSEWRIRFPLSADAILDVKPQPSEDVRVAGVDRSDDKENTTVTVRLKEPSAEPLHLVLHLSQPRRAEEIAVTPFEVLGAVTQKGEIEVRATDDLRIRYQMLGDLNQREITDEQRRDEVKAVFSYWNIPTVSRPAQRRPAFLLLHIEPTKGVLETRVSHMAQFILDRKDGPPKWQLTTRVSATPIRTAVDRLEVYLPASYQFDNNAGIRPAELVEDFVLDPARQVAQIRLAQKQIRPFSLAFTGYFAQSGDVNEASFELPRVLRWTTEPVVRREVVAVAPGLPVSDRGGEVKIVVPEGLELTARSAPANLPAFPQSLFAPDFKRETDGYVWNTERMPSRLEISWSNHRLDLPVSIQADVLLDPGRVRVREQLRFGFQQRVSERVKLRVPADVRGNIRIIGGGAVHNDPATPGEILDVDLTKPVGKQHDVTLEYSSPLPGLRNEHAAEAAVAQSGVSLRVQIPLVQVVQATRGDAKVRIWAETSTRPTSAGGNWEELATEIVPEHDSVPALVLRGSLTAPLWLSLTDSPIVQQPAVLVDRVLARVTIAEDGSQMYDLRYTLGRTSGSQLDVILPLDFATSNLEVRIAGKRLPIQMLDDTGQASQLGKCARIRIDPGLDSNPTIVGIRYRLNSDHASLIEPFRCALRPAVLRNSVHLGRTRWHIELPSGRIAIYSGNDSVAEDGWGLRGWLIGPHPALSGSDLEQWPPGGAKSQSLETTEPSFVASQTAIGTLPLVHVPERAWLFGCSVIGLLLGWGVVRLRGSSFWFSVILLGLVLCTMMVLCPEISRLVAYGCEPALVVAFALAGTSFIRQGRYHRHIMYIPGFTRLHGSTLARVRKEGRFVPSTGHESLKQAASPSSGVKSRPRGGDVRPV